MMSDSIAAAMTTLQEQPAAATNTQDIQPERSNPSVISRGAPIMSTTTSHPPTRAQFPPAGWVQGSNNVYSSTNLALAVGQMNSIGNTIHDDLLIVEQEVSAGNYLSEGHINDIKELCSSIGIKVDKDYREAAGKVARMDLGNTTNAVRILEDNVTS